MKTWIKSAVRECKYEVEHREVIFQRGTEEKTNVSSSPHIVHAHAYNREIKISEYYISITIPAFSTYSNLIYTCFVKSAIYMQQSAHGTKYPREGVVSCTMSFYIN